MRKRRGPGLSPGLPTTAASTQRITYQGNDSGSGPAVDAYGRRLGPSRLGLDDTRRRQLYVRRQLHEASAIVTQGLEDEWPLANVIGAAERLLTDCYLEILAGPLGDE